MKPAAFINSIYIAHAAGAPMRQLTQAELMAGFGIRGDRYSQGIGAFSKAAPPKIRHITLIAKTGIVHANHILKNNQYSQFTEAQTRRNLVIDGISPQELNDLIGEVFYLGGLTLKGIELCAPCQRPANLLKKEDFINSFEGRGGIRAAVLESGQISTGDNIAFFHNGKSFLPSL